MSHAESRRIANTAASDKVSGLTYYGGFNRIGCDTCMRMQGRKGKFKRRAWTRSKVPGQRIHSDIKEVDVRTKMGHKYAIGFIDDATRRGKSYTMRHKSEAIDKWQQFLNEEILPKGRHVKYFRSDNGSEYSIIEAYNNPRGCTHEYSSPYCQSGNGVAEVYWRETFKYIRNILWDQQRSHDWWGVALGFADHTRNHLVTEAVDGQPPEAAWQQQVIDYSHLTVPLADCWFYVEKQNRGGTLEERNTKGILVGYAPRSRSYMVYVPETGSVYNRRYADVTIDERLKVDPHEDPQVEFVDTFLAQLELDREHHAMAPKRNASTPGFITLSKNRSVKQLAELFGWNAEEYLALLHSYGEWYTDLVNITSVIQKGSDIPIPQLVDGSGTSSSHIEGVSTNTNNHVDGSGTCSSHIEGVSTNSNAYVDESDLHKKGVITNSNNKGVPTEQSAGELTPAMNAAQLLRGVVTETTVGPSFPSVNTQVPLTYGNTGDSSGLCEDELSQPSAKRRRQETHAPRGMRSTPILITGIELSDGVRKSTRLHHIEQAKLAIECEIQEMNRLWLEHAMEAKLDEKNEGSSQIPDPKGYKKAHSGPYAHKWAEAEEKEWKGLLEKGTFEDHVHHRQTLHHLHWVYKRKSDGTFKARLVLDGSRQDPGSYGDTKSPTMRLTSLRILLSLSATHNWKVFADDATQAFVQSKRPQSMPLWAAYPQGKEKPGHCLFVDGSIYGTKCAPKLWFDMVKQHMIAPVAEGGQGLTQSKVDEAMFHGPGIYVIVHVDDFASTGEQDKLDAYRERLHKRFQMTGSEIDQYYGLDIHTGKGYAAISCDGYMERTMAKLKIKPRNWSTPMDSVKVLPKLDKPLSAKLQSVYRTLVGCCQHPAICCRPDASTAVRELASPLFAPGMEHVAAAHRVLQYLHYTRKARLEWKSSTTNGTSTSDFFGTCDASYNATHDSKGITGWAYHLNGGAISWSCKAQPITTLSSTEAELIAVDSAVRELRFLHKLLDEFGQQTKGVLPTIIGQDNMACITLCESTHFNARTKHIALRYHHCGDMQRLGVVKLKYLQTSQIPADALTKPLGEAEHVRHREVLLGHKPIDWSNENLKNNHTNKLR